MLKLSWTKENVAFVDWYHELQKHFAVWDLEKLPTDLLPYFNLFMENKSVAEALTSINLTYNLTNHFKS